MAAFDGENAVGMGTSPEEGFIYNIQYVPDSIGFSSSESLPSLDLCADGEFVSTGSGGGGPTPPTPVVTTIIYHLRAWRTESAAYVEWDTNSQSSAYPGGGTLDPPNGIVLYQRVV